MDDNTIDEFFRSAYPGLVASVAGAFGGRVPAEDVVQEALVRAWQRGDGADPIASLPGWVRVVATNLGRDHLRREGALGRAYLRWHFQPESQSVEQALGDRLAAAVARLPPRQQQIVVLHYRDDRPVDAIAAVLGLSSGTVKSTLSRARRTLATLLRPGGETPVKAWFMAGSHPADYEHGIDPDEPPHGGHGRVAFLRSRAAGAQGFGTLMQAFGTDAVRGRRVRFSGLVRGTGVTGWAGLWMRVDGSSGRPTAFDNMQDRAIQGDQPWARYEVVLDVAEEAVGLALGTLLSGSGRLWLADFGFETVSADVPTTAARRPALPENLDFSQDC
ncbi:MAG: sigma-70 family RNA polymerase sigma factor [Acidimicrobiales bacterium]